MDEYICAQISSTMNLQDILAPIKSLFLWTFGLAEAGNMKVNYVLMALIFGALVYWTSRLMRYESSETPNR
ncbi:MAG: hypothetical protein K9J06_03645 [Flavobacteriales bacterium]|nr:hypothetical protein [Flavobacteriales bacterium]